MQEAIPAGQTVSVKDLTLPDLTNGCKPEIIVNDDVPESASDSQVPTDRVILGLEEIMSEIKNVHKVASSQWQKWNQQQRALFNGTYEDILNVGPELFLPTVTYQRHISDEEFNIIAWNAAWTAAHILNGEFTTEMHTMYRGAVIAVDRVTQRKVA